MSSRGKYLDRRNSNWRKREADAGIEIGKHYAGSKYYSAIKGKWIKR